MAKRIPLWREERYLQLRGEFINAFNHTQFSSIDGSAIFNPAGQQTNLDFRCL